MWSVSLMSGIVWITNNVAPCHHTFITEDNALHGISLYNLLILSRFFFILIRCMFQQLDKKTSSLWIHFQKTRSNTFSVNISQLNGKSSLKNSYKYRDYMTQNMIKEKMIMKKTIISVLRIFAVLQMTKYVVIASISCDPRPSRN